jgi:hypothetical protein
VFGAVASIKSGWTLRRCLARGALLFHRRRDTSLTNREASGAAEFTGQTASAFTFDSRGSRLLVCRLATLKTKALLLAEVRHKLSAHCFTCEVNLARGSAAIRT